MSICAPSLSRTSLLSSASKAVKSMPCRKMSAQGGPASKPSARTSAQDISASSAIPSKGSKVSNAESTMASAVAITSISASLNRATDCIQTFQDMLSTGTATAAADPPHQRLLPRSQRSDQLQ
ncbi:hypothetical protein JVT61DRAFT_13940 [Boletus reticuloceps]|uniref:Uncharacterized protein n=1 Tax=Boletus reticuloceps TaxID=495285 RepID=A0A8I2YV80_9AGAM|nr:hypothetical protein JVT61DRAFT_13940 [Boletus reticuloceps]